MNQLTMFEQVPERPVWRDMITTVARDQEQILRNIMQLYLGGHAFHCDVTYSKGVFWKRIPPPTLMFDIAPQHEFVRQADCRHLPLHPACLRSVIFDPPFKASNSKVKGIIEQRFTAFKSVEAIFAFYRESLDEFYRVLEPGGVAVVKCQDTVSSGKNHWSHREIEEHAKLIGFDQLDLFILLARSIIWSPNMANQQHARKAHSFFLVFRKPK